jgi:hypothetical protein
MIFYALTKSFQPIHSEDTSENPVLGHHSPGRSRTIPLLDNFLQEMLFMNMKKLGLAGLLLPMSVAGDTIVLFFLVLAVAGVSGQGRSFNV